MPTKTWFSVSNKTGSLAEVSIYDEIGAFGISAQAFLDSLNAIGHRRIRLLINSPGGSVFHGLAIYNRLKAHKPGVEVSIDGLAGSIASVICMAGDHVVMPENAWMLVHNPSGLVMGESEDLRKTADLLDRLKQSLLSAYADKTGLSHEQLDQMLDDETWLDAKQAVEMGFADEVSAPLELAAKINFQAMSRFAKAPAALMAQKGAETDAAVLTRIQSLRAMEQECVALRAEVASLKDGGAIAELTAKVAKLERTADLYDKLKRDLGLKPAAIVPEINLKAADFGAGVGVTGQFDAASPAERQRMMSNPDLRRQLFQSVHSNLSRSE